MSEELKPAWIRGLKDEILDHRYYQVTKDTLGGQFEQYFLLLRDAAGSVRIIQPIFIAEQDFLAGLPVLVRKLISNAFVANPGLMRFRMLMVGCTAGEGNLAKDLKAKDQEWVIDALGHSPKPPD